MRQEHDSLGGLILADDNYFGVQTLRAHGNFDLSSNTIGEFPELIKALAVVKRAAAETNGLLGLLPSEISQAIMLACDEVIAGQWHDSFIVDVFQGGAGTSSNMNANEVIANRALELLGRAKGDYRLIHPNDHVNMSQSTNDVFPTAVRLAILFRTPHLTHAIERLAEAFTDKSGEFEDVIKVGRTQLQDAVPMTLGQEFKAFSSSLAKEIVHIKAASSSLLEINIGGTAIGTELNAPSAYRERIVAALANATDLELTSASDLIAASWDTSAFVEFSSSLKRLAIKLSKIANDLRLLSSGPRAGLGEIKLPPRQPGSSIMPGKVNPVIPESVNQVCFHVIGSDLAITLAAEAGQLQLNAFEPLMAYKILDSMRLLERAMINLREFCIVGIEADIGRCSRGAMQSLALSTALVPLVGYPAAAAVAQLAHDAGICVRDAARTLDCEAALLDQALNPINMIAQCKAD